MKKSFKRAGVAVLSMAMLISMGAIGAMTANAAVTTTAQNVTIADTYGGNYNIYKVLDASVASGGLTYTYAFATGFAEVDCGYSVDQIAGTDESNATDMKALADALVSDAKTTNPASPLQFSSSSVVAAGSTVELAPGYYLIVSDATNPGTQMTVAPMLISVRSDTGAQTVTPKTSSLELDKYITGVAKGTAAQVVGSKDDNAKSSSAQAAVGNVVSYAIETKTPVYAPTVTALTHPYRITDTPSAGLTYVADSLQVFVDRNNDHDFDDDDDKVYYSVSGTPTAATFDNNGSDIPIVTVSGLAVTFNNAFILANQGKAVKVTLDTTVNTNAITVDNTNTATLAYDNDYYEGSTADTLSDETHVYATKLEVVKTFSDISGSSSNYPEATFTLYNGSKNSANIVATASTTASNNVLTFNELAAGSYILEETTVPDGYVKVADQSFTITANANADKTFIGTYTLSNESSNVNMDSNNKYVEASVENEKGKSLPGTGGMGTVFFTVGGAAVVLLAGMLFVVYMRKRKTEE